MNDITVFVIRDFEVDQYVGLALEYLAKFPPNGVAVNVPGTPGAAEQGRLLEDVLAPAIESSEYVIAFMDTPNANVGFELGFALGSGRHVALVCASSELPKWLGGAPLSGYLVVPRVQLPKLQEIIDRKEYVSVTGRPQIGTDVLFLAPRDGEGIVGHELVREFFPSWRLLEPSGWALEDLPSQLEQVGEVVWLVTPYAPGEDRRDGQSNSLNSIVAGYAKGIGVPLRIFKSKHHRAIVDVEQQANLFSELRELENLLKEAEEKHKFRLANVTPESEEQAIALERVFAVDAESYRTFDWYRRAMAPSRSIGRLSGNGQPIATCFLIGPARVLTVWHAVPRYARPGECKVVFEMLREERRVSQLVWTSGSSELDATILQLDSPIGSEEPTLPLAPSLKASINVGGPAYVVGYPRGGALSVSLHDSSILAFDERAVHYRTPTEPGSAGSPVFDNDWNLIAMHHAGSDRMARLDGLGTYAANEGIRADAIARRVIQLPAVPPIVDGV